MISILIVEDEMHLAKGLQFNLEAEGYTTRVTETGEAAIELVSSGNEFDVVLLDVMLPGMDGFKVTRILRDQGCYMPIMMLTARGRPEDIVEGLSAGADDYLSKPFELAVLMARIEGLLRRREWITSGQEGQAPESYEFDDRTVDFSRQQVLIGNEVRNLTLMETNLLRHLLQNEGRNVSRKHLLEEVWGVREDTDTRAIDNFIVRLRRCIEPDPTQPRHLLTVRGVGYRFVAKPE